MKTPLINLMLSLGFHVVGHGASIDRIEEHMNFSDGNLRIDLTDDNNHIYIIRSARTYIEDYDEGEKAHPVYISNNIKKALEPFLLPEESIVIEVANWRYQPYIDRENKAIEYHNQWCRENGFLDLLMEQID